MPLKFTPRTAEVLGTGGERVFLAWLFAVRNSNKSAIDEAALKEYTRIYARGVAESRGVQR